MSKPGPYIWMNGFPGVGKLTIARQLQQLIPSSALIDNHSLIDQVTVPRDHPDYDLQRAQVRDDAFAKWVYATGPESQTDMKHTIHDVVIFTDCYTNGETGTKWAQDHRQAAKLSGRPFLPVYLHCSKEENLRRVVRLERSEDRRGKLTDAAMVARFLDELDIYRFPDIQGLDMDVTNLQPEQAARIILEATAKL